MQSFTDNLAQFERDLAAGDYVGYLPRAIPHALDARVAELVRAFDCAPPDERALFSSLHPRVADVLLGFAERRAALAVRTASSAELPPALVAAGLAIAVTDDQRDGLLILPLLWDAATRTSADGQQLFTAAATRVPEVGAAALREFARRRPEDQTLACMGYAVGRDGQGFRYRRTW